MATIERIDANEYIIKEMPKYVDVNGLLPLFAKKAYKANIILVGPKGIGKTLGAQTFAFQEKVPLIPFNASEDIRRGNAMGQFSLEGGTTPFRLGPVTTAIEIANEYGKAILNVEEINALTPQMQKLLNSLCDWRQHIEVPECKTFFRLRKGAQLWVIGTMNTAVYGGVYQLNEDLKSRFRMIVLDYPEPKVERKIVTECLNGSSAKLDPKTIDHVLLLAHETRQKSLEYALSTRDVVQVLEDIADVGIQTAIAIVLGKFEGADRDTVRERARSIFGVTPSLQGTV